MNYKAGEIVRIKKDLKVGKLYGSDNFDSDMKKYRGRITIVKSELNNLYKLEVDNQYFNWTDEMLEAVDMTQPTEPQGKIEHLKVLLWGVTPIEAEIIRKQNETIDCVNEWAKQLAELQEKIECSHGDGPVLACRQHYECDKCKQVVADPFHQPAVHEHWYAARSQKAELAYQCTDESLDGRCGAFYIEGRGWYVKEEEV